MGTNFNFKSQTCTSREQSERLLALGLKKETADCYLFEYDKEKYKVIAESWLDLIADEKYYSQYKDVCFPAWSLHRLLELALCNVEINIFISRRCFWINKPYHKPQRTDLKGHVYNGIIDYIEWLIKEGYFPKEYLV